MYLRDLYCGQCGTICRDVLLRDASHVTADIQCDECGEVTTHLPMCNGGTKARYRINDWPTDPRFYRGQVEVVGHSATLGDKAVQSADGKAIQDRPQFADADRRGERREKHYWESDRKRGRTPLFFDGAKHGDAAGKNAVEKE